MDAKSHCISVRIFRYAQTYRIYGNNGFYKYIFSVLNEKVPINTYTLLNDVNLGTGYGGGREYFDRLYSNLESSTVRRGRFCNDNSRSLYYPRGYTYGEDSEGEFPDNSNLFDLRRWRRYSPFNTCASAQMLIKKEAGI